MCLYNFSICFGTDCEDITEESFNAAGPDVVLGFIFVAVLIGLVGAFLGIVYKVFSVRVRGVHVHMSRIHSSKY